jgi:hypothetical protein
VRWFLIGVPIFLFVASFWLQARREGLSMREFNQSRRKRKVPHSHWMPLAVWALAIVGLYAAYKSKDGFEWTELTIVPVAIAFIALTMFVLRRSGR